MPCAAASAIAKRQAGRRVTFPVTTIATMNMRAVAVTLWVPDLCQLKSRSASGKTARAAHHIASGLSASRRLFPEGWGAGWANQATVRPPRACPRGLGIGPAIIADSAQMAVGGRKSLNFATY